MEPGDTTGGPGQTVNSEHTCAIISKMVSTYIKTSTPTDATTLVNTDDVKRKPFTNQLLPSDLIYNLSDVEKFLPKIEENANVEDFCGETLTRKRKERQDSGSFSAHECKVTRSNSEERSVEVRIASEDNIRRVSSHEDFEKYKKPLGHTQAQSASSHEQSGEENHLPLRAHNRLETSSDSVHVKDINKSAMIGEKFSRFSVQDLDNENSLEYYGNVRQKYSKNDSSPSRSSIHEYILFPKKISPNRDPNAFGRAQLCEPAGAGGGAWEMESEAAEKARSSERRSRTRRAPPRRQPKHLPGGTSGSLKENDLNPGQDGANENASRKSKRSGKNPSHRDSSSSIMHDSQNNISSVNKSKGNYERIYDEKDSHFHSEREIGPTKLHFKNTTSKNENVKKMRDRSQSPSVQSQCSSPLRKTPFIDLKTLHQQLGNDAPVPSVPIKFSDFPNDSESFENLYNFHDDSEPLLDDNIAGYSKEISEIQNQKRILPDICDYGSIEVLGGNLVVEPDERLNKISKKIQTLKKKISKCEVDFELLHGYRASHADKMNDSTLRKLYAEIRKLKYERKSIKKGPSESILRAMPIISHDEQSLKTKPIADVVLEIERRLEAKRSAHGRPEQLEKCSRAQLVDEKAAVQRALLWLEGARGRPSSRPDRDTARPLYDRYRVVKRLVASFDAMKLNCSNELATIMENEALPFTSSDSPEESPEYMDKESNSDADNKDSLSENKEIDEGASSSAKSTASDQAVLLIEEKREINENLHILPLHELNKLLVEAKGMKLSLRATIKTMEANYENLNGRSLTGDDKELILQTYAKYKETKARTRLLTALVNKQKKM